MTEDLAQEDELERMLQEAERLAAKIRAAAASHSQSGDTMAKDHASASTSQQQQQRQPSPPQYPPRNPSGSTIDTQGVPIDTVQIPHNQSIDDDALTLSSNLHVANPFDQVASTGENQLYHQYSSYQHGDADMEAALRATQNMEKALQALGAVVSEGSGGDWPTSAVAASPPQPPSPPDSPPAITLRNSTMTTTPSPRPPPPPPPPATSSSFLPQEGDEDYVPMKDYSFRPSKFVPDTDVNWEEVDTAHEDDTDFVPLRDYSSVAPTSSSSGTARAAQPTPGGGTLRRRWWTRRQRRRLAAVGGLTMLVLLLGITSYSDDGQGAVFEESETTENLQGDDNNNNNKENDAAATAAASASQSASSSTIEYTAPSVAQTTSQEPIQVKPLEWATHQLNDDNDRDIPLDPEGVVESSSSPLEEHDDEEDTYVVIDIEPARNIKCTIPLAWILLHDCHPTAELGERLEAVLHSMLN